MLTPLMAAAEKSRERKGKNRQVRNDEILTPLMPDLWQLFVVVPKVSSVDSGRDQVKHTLGHGRGDG